MSPNIGMCQSEYEEQPPEQLTCNPYLNTELKLECIVSLQLSALSGRPIVDWFHSNSMPSGLHASTTNPLAINRLDDLQENVTIREQRMLGNSFRIRSQLQLVLGSDGFDVGQYWCGIHIDLMEWMILSDPVLLQAPGEYDGLLPCSTNVAQSKRERKCAAWTFSSSTTTIPTAVRSTDHSILPASTPPATNPMVQSPTTDPAIQSTTDPAAVQSVTADPLVQVEATVTTDPAFLSTFEAGNTTSDEGSHDNEKGPLIEFYIAIGVLVAFASIITVLVSVVTCMGIKYRRVLKGVRELHVAILHECMYVGIYMVPCRDTW